MKSLPRRQRQGRYEAKGKTPTKMATWVGRASIKGNSEAMRMILLTFNSIGITFTWGVEMTYCTPYLLSLGLTKDQTSLVWVAGPLSGLIMQPIIGVISDESRSKWGRRRPIMVIGSVLVAVGLLTLGFTKEIVELFVPGARDSNFTVFAAILALYITDFAINAVMSCSRSLVVDSLPTSKQQAGAAWSGRMASIGNLMGYGAGAIDLVGIFGTRFGDTQFKQLAIIAALGILVSTYITCWAVSERVLLTSQDDPRGTRKGDSDGIVTGLLKVFRQIWSTTLTLPPPIQAICWAVFWSWIGWYPFMIYGSTWVGETYFRYDVPDAAQNSQDTLGDMGRIGSYALAVYSCVTFLGAWILPQLVESPDDHGFTPRPPRALSTPLANRLWRARPSLLTVWIAGHLTFASAMFFAPLATSFRFATALMAICGVPWTISMWAPTTFLGIEVNKLAENGSSSSSSSASASYRRMSDDVEMMPVATGQPRSSLDSAGSVAQLYLDHGSDAEPTASSSGELSGVYFGILNIFTTLPQFAGTAISWFVFRLLDPGRHPELTSGIEGGEEGEGGGPGATTPGGAAESITGPNAISVCLFIGAVAALGAAYATRRLKYL